MSAGQTTITFFPWQGTKSTVGTWTRASNSSHLAMGNLLNSSAAINDEANWDTWLDSGTWKFAHIGSQDTNEGIITVQFNGSTQGTIDQYAAATTNNVYNEITGLVRATAGIVTLKALVTTKNASSSSYVTRYNSIALIKTAGAHTSGGTDTPGYTVEIIPWAGSKANTGWATRIQGSARLGGGAIQNTAGLQNDAISWDIELDSGTYKYAQINYTDINRGIYTIQLNAVSKGTIDGYAASGVENVYTEVTGITVAASAVVTFQLIMATKNASSSAYYAALNSSAWVRTGA